MKYRREISSKSFFFSLLKTMSSCVSQILFFFLYDRHPLPLPSPPPYLPPPSSSSSTSSSSVLLAHEERAHEVSLLGSFRFGKFAAEEPRHHVMLLSPNLLRLNQIHLTFGDEIVDRAQISNILVRHKFLLDRRFAFRN